MILLAMSQEAEETDSATASVQIFRNIEVVPESSGVFLVRNY